jgi:hypothetical protein
MLPRGILTKNLFCRLVTFLKFTGSEKASKLTYIAFIIIERIALLYIVEKYRDLKIHVMLVSKAIDKVTIEMVK